MTTRRGFIVASIIPVLALALVACVTAPRIEQENTRTIERVNELEARIAELEADLATKERELEIANSAVESLADEVRRLSDRNAELEKMLADIREIIERLESQPPIDESPLSVDRKVSARVTEVRREDGLTYAQIDAGRSDGVREGVILTLGDGEGNYLGRLRIIRVDEHEATGIAETPQGAPAGVEPGDRAVGFPRRPTP